MTRTKLIAVLASRFTHLTVQDAAASVEAMPDAIAHSLAQGGRVEIRDFGNFSLNYRSPRTGRNPKTGATVHVPGKHVPHFKPGKALRKRVDQSMR